MSGIPASVQQPANTITAIKTFMVTFLQCSFSVSSSSRLHTNNQAVKPYNYLTYILDEIRKMGVFPEPEEMDKLLPWSKDLPDEVRTKCKK